MVREYSLSEEEQQLLRSLLSGSGPLLAHAFHVFLKGSLKAGFSEEVSVASLSHYTMFLLCRLIAMRGDVPEDKTLGDEMEDVVMKVQECLSIEMSAFIKEHSSEDPDDENEGYVSPEQRKQDTAAEKADYMRDVAKDERSEARRH